MPSRRGDLLRGNAFLVAAAGLPVLVAGFFLIASVVPRWTVPAPAYDLVLRAARPYDSVPSTVLVDFRVRDGQVEATVRPAPNAGYTQVWALLLFDHETMAVGEIQLDLPSAMAEDEEPRTIVVEALGARVSQQSVAPDGYQLQTRTRGSSGIVGDLFGMRRFRQRAGLINRGRLVPIELPAPYQDPYQSPVYAVGWVLDEGRP